MSSRCAAHSPASARSAGGALFQYRITSGAANTACTAAPSAAVSGRMDSLRVRSGKDMG